MIPVSLLLFASRIPLRRPIGILPDLRTIIGCAMYTDDQSGNNNPNGYIIDRYIIGRYGIPEHMDIWIRICGYTDIRIYGYMDMNIRI